MLLSFLCTPNFLRLVAIASQLKLIQLPALPPVSQPSPTAQQELALARTFAPIGMHAVIMGTACTSDMSHGMGIAHLTWHTAWIRVLHWLQCVFVFAEALLVMCCR